MIVAERKAFVQKYLEKIASNSKKINCWYTVVFFISPIDGLMENRVTYSEHQTDASMMARYFDDTYKKWNTPYYVYSSAYDSNYDGGFFNESEK